MSEKEKNIIVRLNDKLSNLDKDEQNYILGVAEGMAIVREKLQESREKDAVLVSQT